MTYRDNAEPCRAVVPGAPRSDAISFVGVVLPFRRHAREEDSSASDESGEPIDAAIPLCGVHGLYQTYTGTRLVSRLVTDLYTADGPELAAVSQILGRAKTARNAV